MTEAPSPEPRTAPHRRRRTVRRRYVLLLVLVVVALAVFFPPTFQFLLRIALEHDLQRKGVTATIGRVDGSLFSPLVFSDVRLVTNASLVRTARIDAERVTAVFDARRLFHRNDECWLRSLRVEGVTADLELAGRGSISPVPDRKPERWRISLFGWLPSLIPDHVEVRRARVTFRRNNGSVRMEDIGFSFERNQPGSIEIGTLVIDQPGFGKSYADLGATIGVNGSDLVVGNLRIGDSVRIRSLAIDLDQLAEKRLALDYDVACFGGAVRGDVTSRSGRSDVNLEGTGSFENIAVGQVGAFVGTRSETGGTLDMGKFTFRGSLRKPEEATASLRIRATDFQWGERRWHLLVAGATLMNREVRIHELQLAQSGNELNLGGVFDLPQGGVEWWRQNFEIHVSAQINDLVQLSALLGPEAAQASGKIDLDGSVRGQDAYFNGQVIASGSGIAYRGIPIDHLNAAARIRGNELQVRHFELLHGEDYVRGECVVNILGAKQYWGELKASLADLSLYSPVIQPPVAPTAFGGGLVVEWSGDGNAKAHSGAFRASFRQLLPFEIRTISAPLDGDLEATYSPGHIFFSTFRLGSGKTSLETKLVVRPDSVELDGLRVTHDGKPRLEGDAHLPVNAWAGWAGASFDEMVGSTAEIAAKLKASDLPLGDALQLTGKSIPVKGDLNGNLALAGSIDRLQASGEFTLTKGAVSTGGTAIVDDLRAKAVIENGTVRISEASGRALGGRITGSGTAGIANPNDSELHLSVRADDLHLALAGGPDARANLDVDLDGPASAATVAGSLEVTEMKFSTPPDASALASLLTGGAGTPHIAAKPFRNWRLRIEWSQDRPLALSKVTLLPDVTLSGPASAPVASGAIRLTGAPVVVNGRTVATETATVYFDPDNPEAPVVAATGTTEGGLPFALVGPVGSPELAGIPDPAPVALALKTSLRPSAETRFTLPSSVGPASEPILPRNDIQELSKLPHR